MKNTEFGFALFGGPEGIRTHDLTDANRTLSQLSYRPKKILKYLSADYHNTLFSICEPPFSFFC